MAAQQKTAASKLSDKQARFVDEYLVDLNAAQAAIRAGYAKASARQQGNRLLTNDDIAAAIAEKQEQRGERTQITADRVLQELARIGLSDLRGAFTPGGALLPPEYWPEDLAASIASVEVVTKPSGEIDEDGNKIIERVHKLRLWDKNSALEKIGKHLGMFVERHEHTGKDGKDLIPRVEIVRNSGKAD